MEGGSSQLLRARIVERDREIHQLQSTKVELEDKLNDAVRRAKASEAMNRRLSEELAAAKWLGKEESPRRNRQATLTRHASVQTTAFEENLANDQIDPSVNAQLVLDLQDMKLQSTLWKTTAQLVLQSYRTRLAIVAEEQLAFDNFHFTHAHTLGHWLEASESRRLSAERSYVAAEKFSEVDESRRLEQFRELAALRERMVLLEREKQLSDRRVISQDEAIHALEGKVRELTNTKRDLEFERDVLLGRVDKLGALVLDQATIRDGDVRTGAMSHSQLRAELSRMAQELAICKAEKAEQKERLRHALRAVRSPGGVSQRKLTPVKESSPSAPAPHSPRRGMSLRRVLLEVRQPQLYVDATSDLFQSPRTGVKANRSPRSATRPFR